MEHVITGARWIHILFGAACLALFWIPVFAVKGGPLHRRIGRWYYRCAQVVLGTAGLTVLLRLGHALATGVGPSDQPMRFAFIVFLGYLAFVTWVAVRHGVLVLQSKHDREIYRTPVNRMLGRVAVLASILLVTYALYYRPPSLPVLLALSPIGLSVGSSVLGYYRGKDPSPKAWFYEHMGAMLGAGVAFHTAFAVFGMTRLFDLGLSGWIAVIPWILPAAIGIPAISIWTRHYKRRFGDLTDQAVTT